MYCSNGSSMATLLQQKNCMKTLTNGGAVVGGNNGNVSSNNVGGGVNNQSGTSGIISGSNSSSTKLLLPHEMVSSVQQAGHSSQNNQTQQTNHHFYNNFNSSLHYNDMYRSSILSTSSGTTTTSVYHQQQQITNQNQLHLQQHHQHQQQSHHQHHHHQHHLHQMTEHNNENNEKLLQEEQQEHISSVTEPNNQQNMEDEETEENQPEIDIVINNVVCSFSVRCHLNLREIALNGFNVEFRRENGMVTMKLRRPYTTASIWSSGRITCTGATSEDAAHIAARRYARCLQKLGFKTRFNHFRVVNVLGTCSMPWAIRIVNFSEKYKKDASYEPELHPGVTYKIKEPKATLKIFSTGSITVTAASVAFVQSAIEHIFPLVYEFRKKRPTPVVVTPRNITPTDLEVDDPNISLSNKKRKRPFGKADNDPTEDIMYVSDTEMEVASEDDV